MSRRCNPALETVRAWGEEHYKHCQRTRPGGDCTCVRIERDQLRKDVAHLKAELREAREAVDLFPKIAGCQRKRLLLADAEPNCDHCDEILSRIRALREPATEESDD